VTGGPAPWRTRMASVMAGIALWCGAGCVTIYEEPPKGLVRGGSGTGFFDERERSLDVPLLGQDQAMALAVPLSVPFGVDPNRERSTVSIFYRSVLQQLREAERERDLDRLESLLASYERPDVPPAIREHLAGYRVVVTGMRFLDTLARTARFVQVVARPSDGREPPGRGVDGGAAGGIAPPPIGAPLRFELQLAATAATARFGAAADADPARFAVVIEVVDTFVDGGSKRAEVGDVLDLPEAFTLSPGGVLRLPIALDLPGGDAVRRVVTVSVDQLPGYLLLDGVRTPVQRTRVGHTVAALYPQGFEVVRERPLAELRQALRPLAPAQFARVWLAAHFLPSSERDTALELLMEPVRFGRDDQAQVAMAALQLLTGAAVPVGDRDGWLAWWQARR
jgi:hypothetical protein